MKVLIAGGHGQLGRAFQKVYAGHDVTPLSHNDLDISDTTGVQRTLEAYAPDLVLNCAAYNAVDKAEEEPDQAFKINRDAPALLARTAQESGAAFVHISTDYVFDGKKGAPYVESDAVNPLSVYGKSKYEGERAVLDAYPEALVIRTAWIFGDGKENFFRKIEQLAAKGPVKIINDKSSSPTYSGHLAEGIAELVQRQSQGVYHLAGSGAASRYEQFSYYASQRKMKVTIEPVSSAEFWERAIRPKYSPLVSEREPIIRLPGWKEGIDAYIKEFHGM